MAKFMNDALGLLVIGLCMLVAKAVVAENEIQVMDFDLSKENKPKWSVLVSDINLAELRDEQNAVLITKLIESKICDSPCRSAIHAKITSNDWLSINAQRNKHTINALAQLYSNESGDNWRIERLYELFVLSESAGLVDLKKELSNKILDQLKLYDIKNRHHILVSMAYSLFRDGYFKQATELLVGELSSGKYIASNKYEHRSTLLWGLGNVYLWAGMDVEAVGSYKESLESLIDWGGSYYAGDMLVHIGDVLVSNIKAYKEASFYYDKAESEVQKKFGYNSQEQARVLLSKGFLALRENDFEKSEILYLKAKSITTILSLDDSHEMVLKVNSSLQQLYRVSGDFEKEEAMNKAAEKLNLNSATQLSDLNLSDDYTNSLERKGRRFEALVRRLKEYAINQKSSLRQDIFFVNLVWAIRNVGSEINADTRIVSLALHKKLIGLLNKKIQNLGRIDTQEAAQYAKKIATAYRGASELLYDSGKISEAVELSMAEKSPFLIRSGYPRNIELALELSDKEQGIVDAFDRIVQDYISETGSVLERFNRGDIDKLSKVSMLYASDGLLEKNIIEFLRSQVSPEFIVFERPILNGFDKARAVLGGVFGFELRERESEYKRHLAVIEHLRGNKVLRKIETSKESDSLKWIRRFNEQKVMDLGWYWANRLIIPKVASHLNSEDRLNLEKILIRMESGRGVYARSDPNKKEIIVSSGLLLYFYDLFSAYNWIEVSNGQGAKIGSWFLFSAYRNGGKGSDLDGTIGSVIDFVDYSAGGINPTPEAYRRILNDFYGMFNAFSFVVLHEVCHLMKGHHKSSIENENVADGCARRFIEQMGEGDYGEESVMYALFMNGLVNREQAFVPSHPHEACRWASAAKNFDLLDSENFLSSNHNPYRIPAEIYKEFLKWFYDMSVGTCSNKVPRPPPPELAKFMKIIWQDTVSDLTDRIGELE